MNNNRFVSLLLYRYHYIPLFISIIFILSTVLSYQRAPDHYQTQKIFHLSSLGNWQEGLSFFSVGLVLIACLMDSLVSEVLRQRIQKTNYCPERNEDTPAHAANEISGSGCGCNCTLACKMPYIYWMGSKFLFLGLILAGCFQQSFNKPWHLIGVILIGIGFVVMSIFDLNCAWCKRINSGNKIKVYQIIMMVAIFVSGLIFIVTNYWGQSEWDDGKDSALDKLSKNKTIKDKACPGRSINHWLDGGNYPNYYPCKSKSLWAEGDPGYDLYLISGYTEIIMFTTIVLYSFSYWGILDKQKVAWPDCAPNFCKRLYSYQNVHREVDNV